MSASWPEDPAQKRSAELVRRVAAGERGAESEVIHRFQPGVRALVRRHCRPAEPAVDDLVQDVLETILRALRAGSIQEESALPGYVRGTVVFTVQAYYRKRSRRGEDQSMDADRLVSGDDPAHSVQQAALAATVRTLLDELTVVRDREILRRFYLLEQSRQEVCAALAIETAHFHRVLFRARERLRALLVQVGVEDAI